MLGRGAVPVPQKHVRYKTWNGNSIPLPTSTPPRHIQSCKQILFSMFCCTLLYVHSSIAIILMGKRELVALLNLSSWCLVMVERLFHAVPRGFLRFVIVVFPDHTIFNLCAISTQISNSGPNIANPPPPYNTHTNLCCIDFLICAGKSTYRRFMVLVVPHSALDMAAVCDCDIS